MERKWNALLQPIRSAKSFISFKALVKTIQVIGHCTNSLFRWQFFMARLDLWRRARGGLAATFGKASSSVILKKEA